MYLWYITSQCMYQVPRFFLQGVLLVSKVVSTHRTGTHPEKNLLPTGYKPGLLSLLALPGMAGFGCAISGCVVTFLEFTYIKA